MTDSSVPIPLKRITSRRDLAINGAPPAFSEPVHVGRPNVGERATFLEYVNDIFDDLWLTNDGPRVRELESRLADFLEVRHCVTACNGTVALELAIRALGLTGEVVIPSYTFVATAHALSWQEITPVFADIDPHTYNLDPQSVQRVLSPQTSGIIGVHLWGRAADHSGLSEIAEQNGLALLYDAAHAFGCSYGGRPIGRLGRCEVFSFHATKCFQTFEGGAVTTDDDELAARLRLMRNFGFAGYDNVIFHGTNGKMTEICAAMGLANLDAFDSFVEANRANYDAYRAALADVQGINLIKYDADERANYHYVVVELDENLEPARDEIVRALHAENILARRYFWPGVHRMKFYRHHLETDVELPNTESVADRVIVLPTGRTLPPGVVETVADVMRVLGQAD